MTPEQLQHIGELTRIEHAYWVTRNKARKALRDWFKAYVVAGNGENYDPEWAEPEEIQQHDALRLAAAQAQRRLISARAQTRYAIRKYWKAAKEVTV